MAKIGREARPVIRKKLALMSRVALNQYTRNISLNMSVRNDYSIISDEEN